MENANFTEELHVEMLIFHSYVHFFQRVNGMKFGQSD